MRRYLALSSVVVVGALLWLALAWRSPTSDLPVAIDEPESEPVPLALPPVAAAPPAEPSAVELEEPTQAASAEAAPAQPAPTEAAPWGRVPDELIRGDQGPVAEYRKQYDSEARDAGSAALERQLRAGFLASEGGGNLIQAVSCRQNICKIEMRWSMANMRAYIAGLTRSRDAWQMPVAVSPVGAKDERGERRVEVFLKRRASGGADEH